MVVMVVVVAVVVVVVVVVEKVVLRVSLLEGRGAGMAPPLARADKERRVIGIGPDAPCFWFGGRNVNATPREGELPRVLAGGGGKHFSSVS